ncbi:trypsin-like serine protease [Amycolatopsis arida]
MSKRECAEVYGNIDVNTDAYLCAGSDEATACPGDEGGPLMAGSGSNARLIGIVSATALCGSGLPSVFTEITSHAAWIKDAAPGAQ